MKPKIEAGQWWETRNGSRVYIVGITSQIPGIKRLAKQPVAWVGEDGYMNFCDANGKYGVQTQYEHAKDLATLLPSECNSFAWKPEPKWRDARPEDLTYPNKAARFRDHDSDMWENGTLVGIAYRGDTLVWVDMASFHYWQCQVQEDTCK